jgi:WD40 repeat protein
VLCLDQVKNSSNANFLLSGLFNGSIRVWDLAKLSTNRVIKAHASGVSCQKVVNESLFASGSWDKLVKIWNISNGLCVKCLDDHSYSVLDLALFKSHEYHKLISCSDDLDIRMWNLITYECEILPIGLVTSLLINKGTERECVVCASYYDKSIRVWDLKEEKSVLDIKNNFETLKLEFTSVN